MTRKLIITADDYGMCESVNEAIEKCLEAGALRAMCVMPNMPAYAACESLRNRFPQASIGIHWTLTQGRPVLSAAELPSLVGTEGRFHNFSEFRRRWLIGRLRLSEVVTELRAQYERFSQEAGRPDFWNTHHHVHILPGLFAAFVRMGQELGIPAMRNSRRITVLLRKRGIPHRLRHPVYWLKGFAIACICRRARARGVRMPDGTISIPGDVFAKASIEQVLERIPWNSVREPIELNVHPATGPSRELFGTYAQARVREYEVFSDPGLLERLHRADVEMVGFEALRGVP